MQSSSALLARFKSVSGLDRAILYAISARFWTVASNVVTVVLMVRCLTPVEQGYYFTLTSLVALQVIFELGFSFVILQHAAHERAHVILHPDGTVGGSPRAHSRLASVLKLTLRWYLKATMVLATILVPSAVYFFSHNEQPGSNVHWFFPTLLVSGATIVAFFMDPLFSFFEGCGQVREVARMRFGQSILGTVFAWTCMLTHHGLFAPGLIVTTLPLIGSVFLWKRRAFLIGLLRHPSDEHIVSWREEVWPFQWKIAVSWICTYFTRQVFTPILFHYRNPVEAGQMGMTISIVGYIASIVLSWMTTKAPVFGSMVARREYDHLDRLFSRTLWQAMSFLVLMCVACMSGVMILERYFPHMAARIVSPPAFAIILLGTIGTVYVQSVAIYLRSFKREPLLWQSVLVASLTLLMCRLTVRGMGSMGISFSYLVGMGIVGLFSGWLIFRNWRHRIRAQVSLTPLAEGE
jgi:hypothetical protein